MTDVDWNFQLAEQLDWHWRGQLRPRLNGLTDEEYRWEPVPGAWNVRPRGTGTAPIAVGAGEFTIDYATHRYPGDAATALAQLDAAYAGWIGGVRGLGPDDMARAVGPAEGPYADHPMAELVLHINREMLHHGAEIALLRDLYRWHFDGKFDGKGA